MSSDYRTLSEGESRTLLKLRRKQYDDSFKRAHREIVVNAEASFKEGHHQKLHFERDNDVMI